MTDFEKLTYAWHELRVNGQLNISIEATTMMFRYANHGICTSRPAQPEDPRQGKLELEGGKLRRRIAMISVS